MVDKVSVVLDDTGRREIITPLRGDELLGSSRLNKGTAFTNEERAALGLSGRIPDCVESLEEQVERCYLQFKQKPSDLAKNIYLNALLDTNEVLFYRLVKTHLIEMLPIVYTPTIGLAVQQFSMEFRRARGLFITNVHRGRIRQVLQNRQHEKVDIVLLTDGEGVLGIGDQGIGGMDIAVGKLMVYTLCAGIPPARVLPVHLDIGTNNQTLLDDPMYLGCRHPRLTGPVYDELVDEVVSEVKDLFPDAYLHWEDFGRDNARRFLEKYRPELATFNDDMQGTGATVLACVLAAVKAKGESIKDQRIIIFGAGTAGVGIADQLLAAMCDAGLTAEEAYRQFYLFDRPGLLTDVSDDVADFQKPYVRDHRETDAWDTVHDGEISLYDATKQVKPSILIGCSGVSGAFTEHVVKAMSEGVERPIILPLSNPTSLSEAKPDDLLEWSEGRALIATGSPFEPVDYNGRTYVIAQSNNAFVFPGLGLAVIVAKVSGVPDELIRVAADALSECAPIRKNIDAPLLPSFKDIDDVSYRIAVAVTKKAVEMGLSDLTGDVEEAIRHYFWRPEYLTTTAC